MTAHKAVVDRQRDIANSPPKLLYDIRRKHSAYCPIPRRTS